MRGYIKETIQDVLENKLDNDPTTYKKSSEFTEDFINGEIGIYITGSEKQLDNFCWWLEQKLKLKCHEYVEYNGYYYWSGLICYKEINVFDVKKWVNRYNLYVNIINHEFTKYSLIPGLHICKTKKQKLLYCIENGNNETLLLHNNKLISMDCYDYYLNNIYNDDFTIVGVYEYINVGNKKKKLEAILVGKPKKLNSTIWKKDG